MTGRLHKSNLFHFALIFSLASMLAMPAAAFATGTQLGLRITDSSSSQGSSDPATGQPCSTQLGIRVTDSSSSAPLTVSLSFVSGGGPIVAPQAVLYNSAPKKPADPTWEGRRFDGWYVDETCSLPFDFSKPLIADATAYAKWTGLYIIAFDANKGEGSMESMSMANGEPKSLAEKTFMRTGYAFSGWNTKPDGTGDFYADGASVLNLAETPGDTVILYAQWALQVVCSVPDAATMTIDASGKAVGKELDFVSSSVEPLEVSAVKSSRLAGAESVFADQATLDGVRVTLEPPAAAGPPVKVPLVTSSDGQLAGFAIPAKGKLAVAFGLSLPANAKLSFVESAADVAQLTYVIGAVSSQP